MRSFSLPLLSLLLALWLLSGCASFSEKVGKDYPDSARLNYEAGIAYLSDENYEVAEQYFSLVKTKFSFSMFATQAELLMAETQFRRSLHSQAIDSFRVFQRKHPDHECNLFSQFRIAESYMEQMPEDWWFMPPSHERDQSTTERALKAFKRVIRMERAKGYYYEKSFEPEEIMICEGRDHAQTRSLIFLAQKNRRTTLRRLVNREVYAAEFNMKNDRPNGSVIRMEGAFRTYPEVAADFELVRFLAESYEAAKMFKRATSTWMWMVEARPNSEEAKDSIEELARLKEEEANYEKERAIMLKKKEVEETEERAWRKEKGLQMVDPDPNPNEDNTIPLPKPETIRDL